MDDRIALTRTLQQSFPVNNREHSPVVADPTRFLKSSRTLGDAFSTHAKKFRYEFMSHGEFIHLN
jgi:hypothetical protein